MKNLNQKILLSVILVCSQGAHSAEVTDLFDERKEKSPVLDKISVEYQVPYIEVFAWGEVPINCFNKKQVDIRIEKEATYITPRYIFVATEKHCANSEKNFKREKLADLDPSNPASYKVGVLGHRGWIWQELVRDTKK